MQQEAGSPAPQRAREDVPANPQQPTAKRAHTDTSGGELPGLRRQLSAQSLQQAPGSAASSRGGGGGDGHDSRQVAGGKRRLEDADTTSLTPKAPRHALHALCWDAASPLPSPRTVYSSKHAGS